MDKRLLQFILITVMIWSAFVLARSAFLKQEPPPVVAEQEDEKDPAVEEQPGEEKEPAPADENAPDSEKPATGDNAPAAEEEAAVPPPKREWITLGSLDAQSPYRLLVTLDSRGAALERVELASYSDIEDRSGYLGSLALVATQGGCRIEAVGPGTPAAIATASAGEQVTGLQKGDLLVGIDDQEIAVPSDLADYLAKTKPGEIVTVAVQRAAGGKTKTINYTTVLSRRPVELVSPTTHDVEGKTIVDPSSLLMTVNTIGKKSIKSEKEELPGIISPRLNTWKIAAQGKDFVEFSYTIPAKTIEEMGASGKLELFKRYTLQPIANPTSPLKSEEAPAYHLSLAVGIRNLGSETVNLAYRLDGLNGLPLEGWWYSVKLHPEMFASAGARDIVYRFNGLPKQLLGAPKLVSEGKKLLDQGKSPEISLVKGGSSEALDYIGVDTQFFAAVMIPDAPEGKSIPEFSRVVAQAIHDVRKIARKRERTVNTSFSISSTPQMVDAGKEVRQEFTLFLGPKDPPILAHYQLGQLVEYGWVYAAYPAHVLRTVLDFMYMICGNYGLAIVLLTVAVRCCMLPFSLKQARSAAKMQEMAPEMQKIREKYKDDMEGQGKAMQELYAREKFNPFGGCLLMFFQLPVFIGLYRCLAVDIDLRDAPLIPGLQWASNLAGPDRLFDWKAFTWPVIGDEAEGWFGPYFNVLPFVTIVLFIMQQKLFTPPATDEQSRMQQKMMTYMTLFMGIMFYRVPAGLCVYIITSSLWGIAERKLLPKPKPKNGDAIATKPPPKPRPALPSKKKKK